MIISLNKKPHFKSAAFFAPCGALIRPRGGLLAAVTFAARAFLIAVCTADLNFIERAVAAVVIVPAHINVAGDTEIDVFHNTSEKVIRPYICGA